MLLCFFISHEGCSGNYLFHFSNLFQGFRFRKKKFFREIVPWLRNKALKWSTAFCAPRSAISPWVMIFCFFFMYDCQVKTASRKVKIFHWSVLKIVRKDLWHTNSIFGECMGGWVEEIEKSYHRVLLGLLRKDSQRKMVPFSEFVEST